jgi:hypothetical protein
MKEQDRKKKKKDHKEHRMVQQKEEKLAHACILATQEAGTRRIMVQTHPKQIACYTISQKKKKKKKPKPKTHHKKRAGGVAQGVGPEFKTQY